MDREIQIENIIDNRLVESKARRDLAGWSLPEASEQETALALKSCRARPSSSISENIEAIIAIGQEGRWIEDDHLKQISSRTGSTIKYLRTSIQRLNRWMAGLEESIMQHGRPTEWGYRERTGLWTGSLPTTLVLAGDATAVGPLAIAHSVLAGARTIVKGSRYEPLAPFLFIKALIAQGVAAPNLLFFDSSSETGAAQLRHLIENTKQSVIYGEDRTINTIYGRVQGDASHKKIGFWAGRSGVLVMSDADLPTAARCIAIGTGEDRGNRCVSTMKAFIPTDLMSDLLPLLIRTTDAFKRGDPTDPETDIGRLDPAARKEAMAAAVTADILYDNQVVYVKCGDGHVLLREEMPYPICAIRTYSSKEDPIAIINESTRETSAGRSLELSIVTQNDSVFEDIAARVHACKVLRNRPTTDLDHTTPHQGIYLFKELMRFTSVC